MDSNNEEEKFDKCWACGSRVLKPRIEKHHILGKKNDDMTIPLCILCHDLVDRIPLDSEEVFEQYFVNCYQDLIKMGEEFKWTKIFFLKLFKISHWVLEKKIKDKQSVEAPQGESEVKV